MVEFAEQPAPAMVDPDAIAAVFAGPDGSAPLAFTVADQVDTPGGSACQSWRGRSREGSRRGFFPMPRRRESSFARPASTTRRRHCNSTTSLSPAAFSRVAAKLTASGWAPQCYDLGATLVEIERIRRGIPDAQRKTHFELVVADFVQVQTPANANVPTQGIGAGVPAHMRVPLDTSAITYGDLRDDRGTLTFAAELFYYAGPHLLCTSRASGSPWTVFFGSSPHLCATTSAQGQPLWGVRRPGTRNGGIPPLRLGPASGEFHTLLLQHGTASEATRGGEEGTECSPPVAAVHPRMRGGGGQCRKASVQ
mmetsp:Transcript_18316/g.59979  ORF Transcript_18316/g.59979 Transcript_18316/m.59979 type:complete len:309 (-) Transcript_18316:275-1201(-)|eukprot:scaffold21834_cov123-Isochrysis_galbana.AAC.11